MINYCANALLGVMTTDLTFWETSVPVVATMYQIFVAVGWGLLIGNCAFQAMKAMLAGLGFETDSPILLLIRTSLFGTLLIFSHDICQIGLSIGKSVIEMLGIPDNIALTFPDESYFSAIGASWLLVIIVGFILGFQMIKLFFEIAERYVVVAVLTLLFPVGLSMGGSKATKDISTGYIRTYASMIVMMVLNVVFLKLILSALATMPSGALVLPWCLLVVGIARMARKADSLISKIGLNPAITGDPLGRGRGTMAAMMAVRTIMSTASRSGSGRSGSGKTGGSTNTYTGGVNSSAKNSTGGTNVGGSNMNAGGSSANNYQRNSNGTQNNQKNNFGGANAGNSNSKANAQSTTTTQFGSSSFGNVQNIGGTGSGKVKFNSTGTTNVNTNRFGSQGRKNGSVHGSSNNGTVKNNTKPYAPKGTETSVHKSDPNIGIPQKDKTSPKVSSAQMPKSRFGSVNQNIHQPKTADINRGVHKNSNPLDKERKTEFLQNGKLHMNINSISSPSAKLSTPAGIKNREKPVFIDKLGTENSEDGDNNG